MQKLLEIKAKIVNTIAPLKEKLTGHPKMKALREKWAARRAAGPNPDNLLTILRHGSWGARLRAVVFLLLLAGAAGGFWWTTNLIVKRFQKSGAHLVDASTYENELAALNERIRSSAAILNIGAITFNTFALDGRPMNGNVDVWARFSDPETAGWANAENVKVLDAAIAGLNDLQPGRMSLFSEQGKELAKVRIRERMQALLPKGKVEEIYFHNLTAQ
ncbi:MAG: hypothetical protein HUU37_06355 [Bdellovibrionales bacterium]|nr:hypothetical protein [Bdellovibrionales bacterium]